MSFWRLKAGLFLVLLCFASCNQGTTPGGGPADDVSGEVSGGTSSGTAADAPPVSLPAPVLGRMVLSPPDENGIVTMTGEAGAVPASSMVLLINEGSGGSGFLQQFLVREAYARERRDPDKKVVNPTKDDSSGAVGNREGAREEESGSVSKIEMAGEKVSVLEKEVCNAFRRSCTEADPEGQFVGRIAASIDDTIAVVIIHKEEGNELTSRSRKKVPKDTGAVEGEAQVMPGATKS